MNSGIEIYFSHTGFENLDKYFEIHPKVEGRFERNGYTSVFIPKKLEAATVYTITVKKGLPLKGTEQKLEKDVVFAFETEPEYSNKIETKGSLSLRNFLKEFSTSDAPLLPLDIYSTTRETTEAVVKTTIYKYKNAEDFIEAIKAKYEAPYWAYSLQEKISFSTTNLTKVSNFEQTFDLTQWQERYLSVPKALEKGFYLVESTFNDLTAQTLIQSTYLSAYFTESDTKTLFWVNSLKTGKAVSGAQISISAQNKTYTTDGFGVATFDTIEETQSEDDNVYKLQYYTVTSGEEKLILIDSGYRTFWRDVQVNASQDYWRFFQTDRSLYKPDDMVNSGASSRTVWMVPLLRRCR